MESTQENFEIIKLPIQKVVGITAQLTRSQSANYRIIQNLWQDFNRVLHTVGGRSRKDSNWAKYGITTKKGEQLLYMTAIPYEVQFVLPAEMELFTLYGGKYVRFIHSGKLNNLQKTVSIIFRKYIEEYSLPIREGSEPVFFERYDSRFHWNREDSIIELYLPLQG